MSPLSLDRNEPSDRDPAVRGKAASTQTRPEFVDRPDSHRCPRCARVWPLSHYRPEHLTVEPNRVKARCRTCRAGLAQFERRQAIETGLCEARGCGDPILDRFQCGLHLALSDAAAEARRASKLAAAAEWQRTVEQKPSDSGPWDD